MKVPIIDWNLETGQAELVGADGSVFEVHSVPFPRAMPDILRARLDFTKQQLELLLPDRTWVTTWSPKPPVPRPLIVYLDQNQMSAVTGLRSGSGRIDDTEIDAARRLIELVEAGTVAVPLSAGHYVEAGPLYDQRRQDLACTMLALSRGLSMKNPHLVAIEEMRDIPQCCGRR